jgi:hypothetical protein
VRGALQHWPGLTVFASCSYLFIISETKPEQGAQMPPAPRGPGPLETSAHFNAKLGSDKIAHDDAPHSPRPDAALGNDV